ncbi:MAG: NAD(P)-dependent oxidoreductase [Egibacteraceae bacterium]
MRILVVSSLDPGALALLRAEHDVVEVRNPGEERLESLLEDREVLILRSGVVVGAKALRSAACLRLVLRAGSGFDNVDVEALARRGIAFERVPGPGARSVAELAFGLMLALARNLLPADRSMRDGRWRKAEMTGHLLAGKTLGVVGLGTIGTRAALMGAAWGMHPIGCVEYPTAAQANNLASLGIRLVTLDEVLSSADFVTVHVPGNPRTVGLLDAGALALLKPTAFLVNLSRGGVVDEVALRDALRAGRLAGAGLDVHSVEQDGHTSALAELDNVVLTPHIGASTADSQAQIGLEIVRIVSALAARSNGHTALAPAGREI